MEIAKFRNDYFKNILGNIIVILLIYAIFLCVHVCHQSVIDGFRNK